MRTLRSARPLLTARVSRILRLHVNLLGRLSSASPQPQPRPRITYRSHRSPNAQLCSGARATFRRSCSPSHDDDDGLNLVADTHLCAVVAAAPARRCVPSAYVPCSMAGKRPCGLSCVVMTSIKQLRPAPCPCELNLVVCNTGYAPGAQAPECDGQLRTFMWAARRRLLHGRRSQRVVCATAIAGF